MRHFLSIRRAGALSAVAAALVCMAAQDAGAQAGSGGQAAAFLKIPVGARLMASPGVVAGMHADASLMYSNPAFIASVDDAGLFISSSRWLEDLSFNAAGVAVPLGKNGPVLGVGASFLHSGTLTAYDDALTAVAEGTFYDLGLDLVLSHRLGSSGVSVAAGATYLREAMVPEDGSGRAFHLGASYRRGRTMIHAAARDLAATMNFADESWAIDSEFLAGAGHIFDSRLGQFNTGAEVLSSDTYGLRLRVGVDYVVGDMFTLRSGYNDNLDTPQSISPFNAGFGVRFGALSLEYAYTPQEYFSSAHTFSLGYSFGKYVRKSDPGAVVPSGDFAPTLPKGNASSSRHADETAPATTYLLVGGTHATRESAQSEAHTLELLKIPAAVDAEGPRYRVVVGRFGSFSEASEARSRYRGKGHVFQIIAH